MNKVSLIKCERNSASDETLVCLSVEKENGDFVKEKETLFELEGAKAVFEVTAPKDGYFVSFINQGDKLTVGQSIGAISDSPNFNMTDINPTHPFVETKNLGVGAEKINLTKSAEKYFYSLPHELRNLVATSLSKERTYRSEDLKHIVESVQAKETNKRDFSGFYVSEESKEEWRLSIQKSNGIKKLLLVGGGYGALQALDLILLSGEYEILGYFSDLDKNDIDFLGIPRLGACDLQDYSNLIDKIPNLNFVITVGTSPKFRLDTYRLLKQFQIGLPNFIHPSVVVSRNCIVGEANLVFANTFLGVDSKLGNANYISSNSSIEHHNSLGDGNCSGPNLSTSGLVTIGDGCRFGAGVVIEPRVKIGHFCVIASNTSITYDVLDNQIIKARV